MWRRRHGVELGKGWERADILGAKEVEIVVLVENTGSVL